MQVGTEFGAYQVIAKLGEGGMGEVYRALDTRLNREVALKVLPDSFAADADRVTRFRREAQVLASLNHPNIAQIYGLEQVDGHTALVMELVSGETLAARIARGALPRDEALNIARQLTEALEAAHEQHIIHRDLKPANIALRPDGAVKVLDFGLAKAMESSGASGLSGSGQPSAAISPTITDPATHAGMILGTGAYMSPEQARGKAVDRRTDIWAFGCVLFEMLTGRRAYDGDDLSLIVAKILEREPDFTLLPQEVSPHVEQTLRLCLQKDAKARISDMGDVRLALEGAFASAARTAAAASPAWQRRLLLVVGASVLVVGGWFAGRMLSRSETDGAAQPVRLSVVLPPDRSYGSGMVPGHGIAVSPDGTRIVVGLSHEDQRALYQRTLSAGTLEQIPGTENGTRPRFSPDGSAIVFVAGGILKTVAFDGRLPKTLAEGVGGSSSAVWRGNEIVYTIPPRREVWRIPASGGTPQRIGSPASGVVMLAAVPGTDDILAYGRTSGGDRIDILTPSTGESAELLQNARLVAQTPSGHLLFERDGVLMAAAFDAARRSVGPPTPLLRGFAYDAGQYVPQVAVGPSGTLVYVVDVPAPAPTLAWVDSSGALHPAGELPARSAAVDLSSTGGLALVDVAGTPRRVQLWDVQRRVPTGLQLDGMTPRWHPDGRRFVVARGEQLLLVDAEDGTEKVLTSNAGMSLRSPSFSSDGSSLAYVATRASLFDIYALMPGTSAPQPVLATDAFEHSPALSPDGKWLAYVEGDDPQVYIVRFPSGTGRRRITANGGNQPLWRRDGRALFYRENAEPGRTVGATSGYTGDRSTNLRVVSVDPGATLTLGVPKTLFSVVTPSASLISDTFSNDGAAYHASTDGSRFLMVYKARPQPLREVAVVQNWRAALQGLAARN